MILASTLKAGTSALTLRGFSVTKNDGCREVGVRIGKSVFFAGVAVLVLIGSAGSYFGGLVPRTAPYLIRSAEAEVRAAMKDPSTVLFRASAVKGATVCGEVNAKNSYGAYVGFAPFIVAGDGYRGVQSPEVDENRLINLIGVSDRSWGREDIGEEIAHMREWCRFERAFAEKCPAIPPGLSERTERRCAHFDRMIDIAQRMR